jgi:hypothetical protein
LKWSILVIAGLTLIFAAQTFAADPKTTTQTTPAATARPPAGAVEVVQIRKVECKAEGAGEFPTSLQIHNTGNAAIPKGWIVSWSFSSPARSGKYTLLAELPLNGYVMAANQMPGGHPGGQIATCTVAAPQISPAQMQAVRKPVAVSMIQTFDCVVQGTPTEFPDDIVITNKGAGTIAKGKVFHWTIPNTSRQGDWVLTQDLLGGKSVLASGVVGGGHPAGAKCTAVLK